MISRRNFFSICVMMATILVLFQFSILIRDLANNYDENIHLSESVYKSGDVWNESLADETVQSVLYVGGENDAAARMIRQWCGYTKRRFVRLDSLSGFDAEKNGGALLLCVSGGAVADAASVDRLSRIVQDGQNVLLCDMPDTSFITQHPELLNLMGIKEVVQEQVELIGIRLFSGFMIGGDATYLFEEEAGKLEQPVSLSTQWYLRMSGTKNYMVGMLADEEIENEELPSLIWRNSYGSGRIFVINGPYMQDETGLGILSAVSYELQNYDIYPVVNAQNFSVVNFPVFASENAEEFTRIYAKNLLQFQSGEMWPALISAMNKESYKMTSFLAPRLDYTVTEDVSSDELTFYLKQFREQDAEAGLSLDHLPGISLKEEIEYDRKFFESSGTNYTYGAAYVGAGEREELLAIDPQGILNNVRTITGDWDDADLLYYCTDTILAQGVTADAFLHLYTQDLRVRAIETALGYSNILLDMKNIAWPAEDDPHWEVMSDRFSRNINTYWNQYSDFEKTTISESDERIRGFLALDYRHGRSGNMVELEIRNDIAEGTESWFILRTHGEDIKNITSGRYTELEEDVYLIHTANKNFKIELEERENKQYFLH